MNRFCFMLNEKLLHLKRCDAIAKWRLAVQMKVKIHS